jgi:hypothetical protein
VLFAVKVLAEGPQARYRELFWSSK